MAMSYERSAVHGAPGDGAMRTMAPVRPVADERRPGGRSRPASAGAIVIVGVICYVLAALMNSASLVRMAEGMKFGTSRDRALSAAHAVQKVARAIGLDRPGAKLDAMRHKNQGGTGTFDTTTTSVDGSASTDPTATTTPGETVDPNASTTAPSTPASVVARVPTKTDKAKLYIAGDSQVEGFGQSLVDLASKTGVVAPTLDFKVSSGLVRPDFFDWPKHLQEQIAKINPDIVVINFGGNDTQGIQMPDGSTLPDVLTPEWAAEYAKRVGAVMDFVRAGGRKLIWVGVPNASDDKQTARLAVVRQVYQQEVAKRPDVTFVDPWPLFESPQHRYAEYVVDDDGQVKQMRQGDGFHLNFDGANRLARHIETEVEKVLKERGGVF
jgi:hypothetical protein